MGYDAIVIGEEGQEEGRTPHLQGYVEFTRRLSFVQVQRRGPIRNGTYPTAWFRCRGTRLQNIAYCGKEGNNIHRRGTFSNAVVQRGTLQAMVVSQSRSISISGIPFLFGM